MKALFSYLRTFLLCFSLLHLPMMPVYAQAEFTFDSLEAAQGSQNQQQGTTQTTTTRTAKGEDVTSQANMGMLTNMLTMVGIGLLGYALYTYTPITTDMMIAAAAGVAYIAGEIMAIKATKEKMKSQDFVLTVREDGTQDNMQRKALEEQKKSYESLAGMMDQKAMLQKVAAAGFAAAAALAFIQKAQTMVLSTACQSSLTAYAATCAPPYYTTPCPCTGAVGGIIGQIQALAATEESPYASVMKKSTIEMNQAATDAQIDSACSAVSAACKPVTAWRKLTTTMNPIMSSGSGTLIASAVASVALQQLGLGSLSGLTMAIFGPFSQSIDLWLASPGNRAIAFGGLAALSMMNASISSGLADKMRGNVQKIDELLRQMDRLQNVQPASMIAMTRLGQDGFFMAANRTESDKLESKSMPCADGKPRNSSGQCASLSKAINEGIKTSLSGIDGLPEGFVTSAGQIGSVADDFINNGGLSSGSLDAANALLANNNAVNNLNRRLMDQMNERARKNGGKEIDFDKEQSKFIDDLSKAMMKGIENAQGQDGRSLMAALNSMGSFDPSSVAQAEEGEQLIDATSVDAAVADIPSFQMPDAPKFDFGMGNDGFNLNDSAPSSLAYNDQGQMQVKISDDYEASESSEIVTNKDVSIFRVISVRYLKSGIPRLIGLEE